MSGDLKKIVEYAEEFLEKSLESKIFLDLLDQAGLKIEHASKNDCLIYNDMPSKYIYILLKGACYSEKYSPSGKLLTAVACKPIEIYGLFEAVHPTLNKHTATIRCASDCSYIRIPIQTYLDQLSRDPEFGVLSLKHLSLLVERILNENEYLLLNNTKD
ncbi:cyclic nucleotide-binding domain-containing protein, partial [Lachnospiraceae bacterium SGI.054]